MILHKKNIKNLLVHFHLYYHNQIDYFINKLKNINGCNWDLYVTVYEENEESKEKLLKLKPDVKIIKTENIGYDIFPFLQVCRSVNLDDYNYVLKIHTKNHREKPFKNRFFSIGEGFVWRNELVNALLGNKEIFKNNLSVMNTNKTGMITSKTLLVPLENDEEIVGLPELKAELNIKSSYDKFCAGSMFLIRSDVIKPLINSDISEKDFSASDRTGSFGTMAHAIERIYTLLCDNAGYEIFTSEFKKQIFKYKFKEFMQNILSIRNSEDKRHKIISILGLKIKIKKHKNSKVIYTCISGSYDYLQQQTYIDNSWDYICFTDNKTLLKQKKIGIWKIKPLQYNKLDSTKNARWHKMHPHVLFTDYEYSLWIDANVDIKTPYIFDLIKNSKSTMLVPIHYKSKCVFEEADYILACRKENKKIVDKAIAFLKKHNMPEGYGQNETNIIYRKHNNKKIKKVMKIWFKCIEKISKRDQLFFSYALWKNDIKVQDISIPNTRYDYVNYNVALHPKTVNIPPFTPWYNYIFQVKNVDTRKIITILGIKMKFKSNKLIERKKIQDLENKIKKLSKKIKKLQNSKKEKNIQIKNLIEEKDIKTKDLIDTLSNKVDSYKRDSDKTFENIHKWQCYLHNKQDINHQNINEKFSVIMPTYNRAFCIERAIDSLINQTYSNWELIIIDDGSTDDTEFIIKNKYGKYLEEEKIIYRKIEHIGHVKARNIGLELAKNPWLAYLDTDNEMFSTFLESFAEAITNYPKNKCFYSRLICSNSEIKGRKFDFESLCERNYIDIGTFVHHKSLIDKYGNFDETLDCLEDWDIIVKYTRNSTPIFIDKILLNYNTDVNFERITICKDMSNTRSIIKNRIQERNNNVVCR